MATTYKPRSIKRPRATKAEVEARREGLLQIVSAMRPMTVRQTYYQATVLGLVEKTEQGYGKVKADLTLLRREGRMPYSWLVDNTRWQRKPNTFADPEAAVRAMAASYRKDLWIDADSYVEVWLEKDALAGVLMPVTDRFDVPLMVSRGYASLSFLHDAAEYIASLDVPTFIYHCGDFDPSGQDAAEHIERELRSMSGGADITFERLAVTPNQISDLELPTRPTKASDTRSKNFGRISVELDAIDPRQLRAIVQEAIERHLPAEQLRYLKMIEQQEREGLLTFADLYREAS